MIRVLGAVLLAAVLAGCGSAPPAPPPVTASAAPAAPVPAAATPSPAALPDRALTPGAAGSSLPQICPAVDPALEARRPDAAARARVYAGYRIPAGRRGLYRVDHLIPLALDGENVLANLWPQPVAESLRKDKVEDALHRAVCAGRVTLAAAQAAIAVDWVTAEAALGIGGAS